MSFFVFLFSFTLSIFAEKIELKDGSVIYGNFEGVMDNTYIIRTKYGILSIDKNEIINHSQTAETIISQIDKSTTTSKQELKIILSKNQNYIEKKFYENNNLIATQVFSSTSSIIISSSGYVKDGIYYEYDENGTLLSEKTIRNGLENGAVIEFYPNGIIKSKIDYKDGKIDGKVYIYSEDGRLILEQSYSDGVLDGFTTEYDLDGNIKSRILYSMGKLSEIPLKEKDENKENIKSNLNEETKLQKIENKNISEFSTKILTLSRNKKVFIYKNKKYTGSFTFDNDYNIIDITGDIPDKEFEIKDNKEILIFYFNKNFPISLKVIKNNNEVTEYNYTEDGKAVRKNK